MAVMARQMDASRGIVEVRDPLVLVARRRVVEARREEAARGQMAGQDRGVFGTLNLHGSKLGVATATSHDNPVRIGETWGARRGWTRRAARLG